MMVYEPGSKASSMVDDPSATQIRIDSFSAPDIDGKLHQWLEGTLYFLVRGDLMVFVQSSSVRIEQFESHLSWLLTTDRDRPILVTLKDKIPNDIQNLVNKHHVKSVFLNGSILESPSNSSGGASSDVPYEAPMLGSIKGLLPEEHGFNWLDGMDGNIEAKLELTYIRKTTDTAQRLLDRLAVTFRNSSGIDAELILGNGEKITKDKLRLEAKRRIEAKDGVLDTIAVYTEMYNWLSILAESGQL